MATTPEISITDNEDGTATVSVSGSSAGSTNLLRSQKVDLQQKTNTWTTHTSRVGDGTISVTLDNGFYYFYVESTLSGDTKASTPTRSRVSDGAGDIFTRCLNAVQSTLQELSLTGLPDSQVLIKTIPQDTQDLALPCVFVCPAAAEQFTPGGGTNQRDEVIYPVMIAYLKGGDQDSGNDTARQSYLSSRQKISDVFRNQRLSGVAESVNVTTKFYNVVDENAWFNHMLYVGGILLNITVWQPRGMF
ncbi:hypothetical protein Pan241w_11240 [Gimesia alba]|uniref:Uncharacterized protein n=1 Tax=Gimesia alba TaxID=2527973 RepID=A0A517RB05_9PLAN|nr:hypothetical protein [Gimesia alba]QDT41065.1 hypothetical protein Pan241w_11240 [Gimesia alba]